MGRRQAEPHQPPLRPRALRLRWPLPPQTTITSTTSTPTAPPPSKRTKTLQHCPAATGRRRCSTISSTRPYPTTSTGPARTSFSPRPVALRGQVTNMVIKYQGCCSCYCTQNQDTRRLMATKMSASPPRASSGSASAPLISDAWSQCLALPSHSLRSSNRARNSQGRSTVLTRTPATTTMRRRWSSA